MNFSQLNFQSLFSDANMSVTSFRFSNIKKSFNFEIQKVYLINKSLKLFRKKLDFVY